MLLPFLYSLSLSANAAGVFSAFGGELTESSCGKYTNEIAINPETKNVYSWWVAGFVTGTNLEKGRTLPTDTDAHEAWLKQYCEDNPLDSFMKATIELNKELETRRLD